MATNASPATRNAIKPTIRHLALTYPSFNIELAKDLIQILLIPEKAEGVHSYLQILILKDLQGWIPSISKETIFKLLRAKSPHAQELGGIILRENSQVLTPELTTSEIVKLANHEIFTVRQAATQIFLQILNRLRADYQEMLAAVRLLESKWDDALHIAIAVTNGVDYLLTWNCKHIANVTIRQQVERACRSRGYEAVAICTPEELLEP